MRFLKDHSVPLLVALAGVGAIIGGLVVRADNAFLHYNACVNFGAAAATDPRLANSAAMAQCHSVDAWFTAGLGLIAGGIALLFLAGILALRSRHGSWTLSGHQLHDSPR